MSLTHRELARRLKAVAKEKSEWAGIPVPLEDHPLHLEPRFPYQLGARRDDEPKPDDGRIINRWFNQRLRCDVIVLENSSGKRWITLSHHHPISLMLGTMMASIVWPLEAEAKACEKLAGMIPEHMMISYMLTGCILETSKRSGITYVFRRLRPTLALRSVQDGEDMRIIAALCFHSIGYYSGTWAGVMVPTDEIISHLVWMRGDEHAFWKMANQHHPSAPQAGVF